MATPGLRPNLPAVEPHRSLAYLGRVSGPLLLMLALVASPLEEGQALYRAGQYGPALERLFEGLERPKDGREEAQLRLYVGLIQWSYRREVDARSSFNKALDRDPKLEAPADAPAGALKLWRELKEAREPKAEARSEGTKRSTPIPKTKTRPPPAGPTMLQPYRAEPRLSAEPEPPLPSPEPEAPDLSVNAEPVERLEAPGIALLAAGGALFVTGVVLSVLAASDGGAALDQEDKTLANERYDRAQAESRLGIAAFIAAGGMVGAAAMTLSF